MVNRKFILIISYEKHQIYDNRKLIHILNFRHHTKKMHYCPYFGINCSQDQQVNVNNPFHSFIVCALPWLHIVFNSGFSFPQTGCHPRLQNPICPTIYLQLEGEELDSCLSQGYWHVNVMNSNLALQFLSSEPQSIILPYPPYHNLSPL